jgi:Asp-tRNA(Asn)/Glu-tRNA(Gln) amidotransferase A subunit family amidase
MDLQQSAVHLQAQIAEGELSPLDLLEACIRRIEAVDPSVNALVARDYDAARRVAEAAGDAVRRGDKLGLLHGLPVAVKDLNPTAGLRTTWGSLAYKDHVPATDDLLVQRLREAGAVIVAKSNTPEFGAGANTINRVYGATVNPFDPALSCAGSSGGSAVALATGMVPLATGSDMGGSLRTPASFCGVVGHRPSPGAVPSATRRNGWNPLSVDGPMGRTVADAALLMAALVGPSALDPLSLDLKQDDFRSLPDVDLGSLRVAFSADLGGMPVAGAVSGHFREIAEQLAPLFGAARWQDPDLGDVHRIFEAQRGAGFLDAYGDFVRKNRDIAGPNVIRNTISAERLTLAEVARAQSDQTALVRRFQGFFDEVDILICPAASVVPFPVEEIFVAAIDGREMPSYLTWIAITYAITLTTHPATAIPCGLGPSGLPFGLQVVGRWRDDRGTLAAAAAIEAALAARPGLGRPVPDLARLAAAESHAGAVPAALEVFS